ncbi:unnamed protein product [Prunus armeniaca]|uniref:HMG-Y-related protein A n=1 Tax=Prunus armeniaca TaxID=36596 RepID=A0A6J5W5L1_PRUAR|nr:unnamed protein product [Prunus armeniaca]
MATENSDNPPVPPPPAPSLPPYPEMIMAAIEALNDSNGSNKSAIATYIESTYGDLPPAHATLLAHHLNKMKQSGELVLVKNNYMKPDPNAPPKRGRGRPPKPKVPLPPGNRCLSSQATWQAPEAQRPVRSATGAQEPFWDWKATWTPSQEGQNGIGSSSGSGSGSGYWHAQRQRQAS